jgi:hypothetical protein
MGPGLRAIVLITAGVAAWLAGGLVVPGVSVPRGAALASESAGHGKADEGGEAKGGEGKKKGERGSAPLAVSLVIPVIRHQRLERQLTLLFVLDPGKPEARQTIIDSMPRLRSAYIMDLMGYLRLVSLEDSAAASESIRARLMLVTGRTLGDGVVQSVYFQQISVRVF